MQDPERLDFSGRGIGNETIEQFYFTVPQERKFDLLCRLLEREHPRQAIIFCRTRRRTDEVYRRLSRTVGDVGCMHGDMRQSERNRVMSQFRSGQTRYLVATDVVGRGIDVTNISHIINYDIPDDCDDYVHRVGRTGRMGREGISFTFATPDQGDALTRIEVRIDRLLKQDQMDLPEVREPVAEPRTRGKPAPAPAKEAKKTEDAPPSPPGRIRRRHRRAL
jgi:ATP-dependent RNA helicase DeaD